MDWNLTRADLIFMVDTLMPEVQDQGHAASLVARDKPLIEAMLDDEGLFQRLMSKEEILLQVSPWLLFAVLLRRAWRDLQQESFTTERRHLQKVLMFDTDRVIELLEREPVRSYLATMLASFTRIESVTIPVRVRRGIWRKYRISDIDVDSLMRYAGAVPEEYRYATYRQIGDACLFLAGMFPEYIEAQHRYPLTRQTRPRARSRICARLEDYEAHGRAFYRLAAEHVNASGEGLSDVLATLSEDFILAEKPLGFVASRYLQLTKHRLFDV
jgi:hypothetical protein